MDLSLQSFQAALAQASHPPDPRRDAVLDAARSAFMDFGLRRTSMGEISRRSGVSPATLYRWFEGKEALVHAVFLREAQGVIQSMDAAVDPSAPPLDQVVAWAEQVLARASDRPLLARLQKIEPELVLPALTTDAGTLLLLGHSQLVERLARFERAGQVQLLVPTATTAELLIRVVHSLLLTPSTTLPLGDPQALRAQLRQLLAGLLGLPAQD